MKVLYLDCWGNDGEFFRKEREKIEGVDSKSIFDDKLKFINVFKFLGLKCNLFFLYFSYGKWKKNIKQYDLFIIDSRKTAEYAIKYIRKKYPQKRIVVWYWNKMTDGEMDPCYVRNKYNVETWTFDIEDAKRYEMKYGNSYYFNFESESKLMDLDTNVFYIGLNKTNRIQLLESLKNIFDNYKIKYDIRLVKNYRIDENYSYSKPLDYDEVLKKIKNCKTILDLNVEGQNGISLRPMEALVFEKKLITNNISIRDFDFYNSKNVFLLNEDNVDYLSNFLNQPYVKVDNNIKERYYFDNWLDRLVKGEEYR